MTENEKNLNNVNLKKQLALFFGGIIAVYIIALLAFWPKDGGDPNKAIFFVLMFAPTFGALLAKFFGKGSIRFGKPNKWIFAAFIPTLVALVAYLIAKVFGLIDLDTSNLIKALGFSVISIPAAMISAIGEEIGWRGFMWPALRNKYSFIRASIFTLFVWWLYHVPLILLGWYGSVSGLAAFTVAITGVTLFIGVITDRSKSLWPSVVLHGSWNALVATSFAYTKGDEKIASFTGNDALLGEFGWISAVATLLLGLVAAYWHIQKLNKYSINSSKNSAG